VSAIYRVRARIDRRTAPISHAAPHVNFKRVNCKRAHVARRSIAAGDSGIPINCRGEKGEVSTGNAASSGVQVGARRLPWPRSGPLCMAQASCPLADGPHADSAKGWGSCYTHRAPSMPGKEAICCCLGQETRSQQRTRPHMHGVNAIPPLPFRPVSDLRTVAQSCGR
jgi:hypothetical protein